jgi:hypothetical protein
LSHNKIRAEKICLNCGAPTPERYCPVCGQENIEPRQTVGHLISHFFSDITHFDGKFFVTVKDLFSKPGFLSREYMKGRRVAYLDPVRMYVFTSAFFFIIFFSMFDVKNIRIGENSRRSTLDRSQLNTLLEKAKTPEDSAAIQKTFAALNLNRRPRDTARKGDLVISGLESEYNSIAQYDSVQMTLPPQERDGLIRRVIKRKNIDLKERFHNDRSALLKEWLSSFFHNFPKFFFFSLPIFALILKLLYIRRKNIYYVDHGIFAIHLYIFSFLVLLLLMLFGKIESISGWKWIYWIQTAIVIFPFWYYYRAMRNFYQQGRLKTIIKYILLFILSFSVQIMLFVAYLIYSILEL